MPDPLRPDPNQNAAPTPRSEPGQRVPAVPDAGPSASRRERLELLARVQDLSEPVMVVLGLVFLALLVADFAGAARTPAQRLWLDRATTGIWVAFVADFAIRFALAPARLPFLRANLLTVASLALPFLRPFRVLRALRAARSLSLVRLLGGANRGMRVLQRVARGRQLAYVAALSLLAALLGAVGVLFFDRDVEGATIRTFGDALWWSAAMVTTINNEKYAVSPEARVVAILLRVFAVSVFGLVTASVASYFVGRDAEQRTGAAGESTNIAATLAEVRREHAALREDLARVEAVLVRLAAAAESRTERPSATGRTDGEIVPVPEDRVLGYDAPSRGGEPSGEEAADGRS